MEIIAHRGASYDAPENTLAAVRLAWEQNADAVEVDIHLSRDGRLVVIHDAHTRRTGRVNKRVRNQTIEELRRLDFGNWKGREWRGQTIPMLDEVIATIPNNRRLLVEFKCGPEAVAEFDAVFRRSEKTPEQIVPIGFSLPTMKKVKAALPQLEVYWATQFRRRALTRRWWPAAEDLIDQTRQAGLDGLDIRASGPISPDFVRKVKAVGLDLFVWTVNSAARARRLAEAGVDGITTDRPGWLRAKLEL